MRQGCFALILIGCLLLSGLGRATTAGQMATATPGSQATPASCPTTSPEENVGIARVWHEEVINHRNPAILSEILGPHAVHHAAGGYPQEMDSAGVTAMMDDFLTAFPDIHITYDLWLQQDDYVVERYTASGTQQGQFGDLPPTGKRATWTGVNIFRIECGRIVEIWSEVDAVSRMQQLTGVIPATPAP